ncbi:unnamed protein product [Didymodactylos carnosus]|uniref:Uncharacterized protein n=1 Tax=Didymodactylos carnosus TaxID=1234261 RepID=A0A8S2FMI4_9BILA|nr:unnamed protein product [Didymodactylos carnosus]CAF4301979.1 unnamed protein product [Didymodactylos carnosus]
MYKLNDSCYSFENIFDDSLLTSHYSQNAHIGSYELVSELVTILSHFGTKLTEDITDKQKLIENENIDCLRILNTNVDLAISNLNKFREKCQNIVKNEVSSAERYLIQLRNEVKTQQSEYYRLILSPTEQCASRYHIKKVLEYVEKLVNIITRLNSIMPIISISVPTENIDNILNFRFSLLNNKQLLNKEQKQTKTRQRGKVPTLSIVQSFVNTNSLNLTNISSLNQIHSTDSTFNSSTTSLSCLSIISNVDVTKYKFGQLIRTKYITYLIATDGQNVLCYNNDANYINFVSLTGYFLSNYKWPTARIIDVCWCPLIDQYLIATRFAIFQFQCTIVSNPAAVKLCFELNECEFVRIACNKLSIFVYTVHHRHSVLQVYDSNFNLTKIFDSLTQRLPGRLFILF